MMGAEGEGEACRTSVLGTSSTKSAVQGQW